MAGVIQSAQSVRNAQDALFDKTDTLEEALLGLTEIVAENSRKLDAIIKHLEVPYDKPPIGFSKDWARGNFGEASTERF